MLTAEHQQSVLAASRDALDDSSSELGMSSSLLASISQGQIATIRRALGQTATYFRGASLVGGVLEQYIQETSEIARIWEEDKTYAVEVFDWSLPSRYRSDGAQIN